MPFPRSLSGGNDIFRGYGPPEPVLPGCSRSRLNIWTTNDNALYTAGLGSCQHLPSEEKNRWFSFPVSSERLPPYGCTTTSAGWLNILNCTLPPVGMILVLAYFMNKKDFETDQPKLKTRRLVCGCRCHSRCHCCEPLTLGHRFHQRHGCCRCMLLCRTGRKQKKIGKNRPEYVPVSYLRNMFRAFYFFGFAVIIYA